MIIGIMGAMPDEVDQLCARLESVTKKKYDKIVFYGASLYGTRSVE